MTTETKVHEIIKAIRSNEKSKLYLKQRTPIVGKFVELSDFKEKLGKGWVRFVNEGNMELWEMSKAEHVTRLYKIEDIVDIKEYLSTEF